MSYPLIDERILLAFLGLRKSLYIRISEQLSIRPIRINSAPMKTMLLNRKCKYKVHIFQGAQINEKHSRDACDRFPHDKSVENRYVYHAEWIKVLENAFFDVK